MISEIHTVFTGISSWKIAIYIKKNIYIPPPLLFSSHSSVFSGPVLGGPRGPDRARRLQRDASPGPGGGLQEHVGGGRPAQERS